MKTVVHLKLIFGTLFTFIILCIANAQTNNGPFSFQGYAIDGEGKALSNEDVNVQFSIYPEGGSVEYTEEHTATTDDYGVFNVLIGSQAATDFSALNFTSKSYKLKVEVKKTTSAVYTTISDEALAYVPYARSAANGVPVGTVVAYAGTKASVPTGWLICDGSSLSRLTYPQLYAALGFAWGGSGDNFNLPDLRGMFLRGVADGSTNDPDRATRTASNTGGNTGDNVGSVQTDQYQSHSHSSNTTGSHSHSASSSSAGSHNHSLNHANENDENQGFPSTGFNGVWSTDRNASSGSGPVGNSGSHNHPITVNSAGGHSHTINSSGGNETRPENAYVFYIIKY